MSNPITSFFGGLWSHLTAGAQAVGHGVLNLFTPVAHDLAHLTEEQIQQVTVTTGQALEQSLADAAAKGEGVKPLDVLHQAGHIVEAQLPLVGINLTAEAIHSTVAAVSAARKQAAQSAPPPPADTDKAPEPAAPAPAEAPAT